MRDITKGRSHIAGDGHDSHNEGLESCSGQYLGFPVFIRYRIELDPTTSNSYLAMLWRSLRGVVPMKNAAL
jgi:hypothetical protein